MKKCIAILAAVVTMFSVSGCGGFRRGTGTEQLDPNRDWIYVGNYNGGLGSAWLQAVIDEFMAENPTWGVWIDNDKDLYNDGTLYDNIATNRQALYFVNGITYQNYVAGGKLAEITDIVTENLPGEEESIEDKMNDTLRDYYKTGGGQYYAVPFFDAPFGTVYDVDLFEEEYLYFDEDGRMICDVDAYFDASGNLTQPLDELKSAGPDGDSTTTFDNGLPATYDQWTKLLQTMQSFGITPYIWTGEYVYYRYRYLASIWADYEGKEAFDLNSSFAGYYTFPGDSEPTKIELSNGYRLQEQPARDHLPDVLELLGGGVAPALRAGGAAVAVPAVGRPAIAAIGRAAIGGTAVPVGRGGAPAGADALDLVVGGVDLLDLFADLVLHLLGRVGVAVGVILLDQVAVGGLDLVVCGGRGNAQNLIGIHRPTSFLRPRRPWCGAFPRTGRFPQGAGSFRCR